MKKCPYCGEVNDDSAKNCVKCFAGIPAKEQKEQPKKAEKKSNKE